MLQIPALGASAVHIKQRPLAMLDIDTAALRAIAQAAVSVELFTIPLYMCTMYSIQGTHQINSKGNTYYKGREWPGMSTSADPQHVNQHAFNIIFSVFIQEMLHLQMAANLATAIGAQPSFTGAELQTAAHGWKCYGPTLSVIPHIVDLKDTRSFQDVRVNLEALNHNQCELFLAIEQPERQAREQLRAVDIADQKYFPTMPLAGWSVDKTAADLPLFGTIGYLYECYAQYISIEYTDGQSLWDKLFVAGAVQQDMFNSKVSGHEAAEFPHFDTCFNPAEKNGSATSTFDKAIDMMAAITDQGEGGATGIKRYRRGGLLRAVQPDYTEDLAALKADYPSYSGAGCPVHSADASARFDSTTKDHYERFGEVKALLANVLTWEQWHAQGNTWSAAMLTNGDYHAAAAPPNIPQPEQVADALNRLKRERDSFHDLSTVAAGAIYGIVSVLDTYWANQDTVFPYPSMVGAGDRMAICWSVLGRAADLAIAVPMPEQDRLYHACQGMNLDAAQEATAGCAAAAIYHSCKGSNGCHAQGGCGFVHAVSGGGSCGASGGAVALRAANLCGAPTPPAARSSAPSDNRCQALGGCAVPISASQLYPTSGVMALYNFDTDPPHQALPLQGTISFEMGENVYAKAWQAYTEVLQARGQQAGAAPAPTALRLALPPST